MSYLLDNRELYVLKRRSSLYLFSKIEMNQGMQKDELVLESLV